MGESKFKPSGASGLHLVRFPNPLVKVGWVSNTPKSGKF